MTMAKNTGNGGRVGAVKNRSQAKTKAGFFVKRGDGGKFTGVKTSNKTPYKGVRKEK
jgi:hypothetical protein